MSAESQMVVLSGKLATELIPKALALPGIGIPEPITRIVLGTMIGALQEQQNALDAKLSRLIGKYYKDGMDLLSDAEHLQGERREEWIKKALFEFNSASHVEDTLLAAKSQFYVGVCYDLLNESLLAQERYEQAYRSVAQLAAQKQNSLRKKLLIRTVKELVPLQQFMNALSPVLFAYGSTLSSPTPTLHLIRLVPQNTLYAFQIILDDEKIGAIHQGESATFEVQTGHHILYLRSPSFVIPKLESPHLAFEITLGEKVLFLCQIGVLGLSIKLWKQ